MDLYGSVAVFTDISCSLKILIRIIEMDRSMRNFADVARYGLGARAEKWVTAMFIADCCIWTWVLSPFAMLFLLTL